MDSKQNATEVIAGTDNFLVMRTIDVDGEPIYHIDLGACIVRYFEEEWEEFKAFAALEFDDSKTDEHGIFAETDNTALSFIQEGKAPPCYILDMGPVSIFLTEEEYNELLDLLDEVKQL